VVTEIVGRCVVLHRRCVLAIGRVVGLHALRASRPNLRLMRPKVCGIVSALWSVSFARGLVSVGSVSGGVARGASEVKPCGPLGCVRGSASGVVVCGVTANLRRCSGGLVWLLLLVSGSGSGGCGVGEGKVRVCALTIVVVVLVCGGGLLLTLSLCLGCVASESGGWVPQAFGVRWMGVRGGGNPWPGSACGMTLLWLALVVVEELQQCACRRGRPRERVLRSRCGATGGL
jgi:hypothetical protein